MVRQHSPTHPDQARISAAIAAAKSRVAVDIRLVSLPCSSRYNAWALLHACIAGLIAGLVVAVARPHLAAWLAITLQFAIALLALACLQSRSLRHQLVPDAALRKAAWRQARLTFAHLRLRARHDEPLVLLFCSRLERYVEVLTDERVLEKVPPAEWDAIVAAFRPHMRDGREGDAFVHLVEQAAKVLEPAFPAS